LALSTTSAKSPPFQGGKLGAAPSRVAIFSYDFLVYNILRVRSLLEFKSLRCRQFLQCKVRIHPDIIEP
jgi:hypothetical protein